MSWSVRQGGLWVPAVRRVRVAEDWAPPVGAAPGDFNPSSLFVSGEAGIFIDASSTDGIFNNLAVQSGLDETSIAAAVDDPISLIACRSQVDLTGEELMINGDFSDGLNGWINQSSATITATIVPEGVLLEGGSSGYPSVHQNINVEEGHLDWFIGLIDATFISPTILFDWSRGISNTINLRGLGLFRRSNSGILTIRLRPGPTESAETLVKTVSLRRFNRQPAFQNSNAARGVLRDGYIEFGAGQFMSVDFLSTSDNATIAYKERGSSPVILTGQSFGSSDWDFGNGALGLDVSELSGLVVVDRPLDGNETAGLTAWLGALQ